MSNELRRPCHWGGKLFDAMRRTEVVVEEYANGFLVFIRLDGLPLTYELPHVSVEREEDLAIVCRLAVNAINDALNTSVRASQKVREGMPDDGIFFIQDKDGERWILEKNTKRKVHYWEHRGMRIAILDVIHRIVGGNEIAREYLYGFMLNGEPVNKKGANDD